ncbi:putative transporter [Nostocoides japonicum T1-X7]|uniref:Magnesium transport protein CorA n=1 Tax=Nostocoides japonicum T1-X7 TaxID=1194083 RepID=A0A077LSZ0_9MICO|nr:magnesium/cobalt transporter CorA [Tetrasphaera japonica]CCH76393.1 putative transporter [Tetrasphaera japonica T1-X7]
MDQATYRDGVRYMCFDLSDDLEALRQQPKDNADFLWIGLHDPTQAEFDQVDAELRLHPLAVEDVLSGNQRAKVERYDDTMFVVLKTLRYIDSTSDVETGEVMLFIGDRFVVTVRNGALNPLAGIRRHLEANPDLLRLGQLSVLHAVVDSIVDNYGVVERELAKDLDDIETRVFGGEAVAESRDIYRLKREVLEARRATTPLVPALEQLVHAPQSPLPQGELRLLFRDVADNLKTTNDHIESYDRLLSDILGAHLAQVSVEQTEISVRQNDDMRKISAWVAIAAVPTMIAGVYGMNFDDMPELRWHYGYFAVLGVMLLACVTLYRLFRHSGWL